VSGQVSGQYNYYKRFAQQRSVNTTDRLRWDIPLGHLTPFVSGTYSTLRNRTYEIDARIRQETRGLEGGTVVRISGRTSFELSGARTLVNYAADESYRGTPLTTLNESTSTEHVAFRYRLTPLTTFVVDTRAMQDRFFYQPLRDANSIKVMPGFDLKPAALISGGVYVGVRRFRPITAEVPAYQGVAATVDANLINGSRLFKLLVGRDVAYSYLLDEPYYALTDATLTVTQRITRTWDVMVRGGLQTLDYHHVVTDQPFPRHLDRLYQYGGGFGYRVGRTIRIGLNALQVSRSSSVLPNYSGLRVGVSVDYGLIQ
jgi:hypothetical protein